jgi:NADH-quinone oxidoreductase subunit L
MILVITGIGSLIHIYSTAYMHDEVDSEFARYFSYLNLFAAFMLILVLGSNFLVMFVGWEGVGLCSYLLIGFWFKKKSRPTPARRRSSSTASATTRSSSACWRCSRASARSTSSAGAAWSRRSRRDVVRHRLDATLLLFIGATGKSAQIPLYVWLPDAMEGPTPVSALIHAATMVTAACT